MSGARILSCCALVAAVWWGSAALTSAQEKPEQCWEFLAMKNYLVLIDHCYGSIPKIRKAHINEIVELKIEMSQ